MNNTPSGERLHIAFFGRRNVGKSSLVNAFTGQSISIVSPVKGTTTDPVSKAMELLPLGPVQIIDTPGFDDEGELGQLRVERTRQILQTADIAILATEQELLGLLRKRGLPHLLVRNKADLLPELPGEGIFTSAITGAGVRELKELTAALSPEEERRPLVRDLVAPGETALLVVPIDKAAPKGRLILPQQQVIRDLLDGGASVTVCRDSELPDTLSALSRPPRLVITDSQVFDKVDALLPPGLPLTSFSILMARWKGDLPLLRAGVSAVKELKDGNRVLIAEGCTHHRQCGDIGTVKLPALIRRLCGGEPEFTFVSGKDFPEDVRDFRLVVHCGGCMQTLRQMSCRLEQCRSQGTPVTNYGMLLAQGANILERALSPFV